MATGRILAVDDERFFREILVEILSGAGHLVRAVESGEAALAALASESYDLLVTDIVMPGIDGVSLVREVKRRDPDMEAIAITGHDDVRLAVGAMKAGCADFLTKPAARDELLQVVDRALSRVRLQREHSQLLSENLQFIKAQSLYRQGLQLIATLDLERLQDLALQILGRQTDAQGVALWIADERGHLQLRGWRGLVDREALPSTIDPRDPAWAERLRAAAPFQRDGQADGESFFAPLVADEEPVGLALLAHRARGRFGPEERAAVGAVADFAAIGARNARRFQALERVGLRDRESGAYNLAYFVDYAGKEFYKARRYGRAFSLVILSVDNVEQIRKEAGRDLQRKAGRDLVSAVGRVVRDADILAKVSESEYYVLLPETDYFGALMFTRRANDEIRKEESIRRIEERCPVLLSMGAASFPKDGEDFDELLHWARSRVGEQRGSMLRRLHLGDVDPAAFWELCDLLLSDKARIPDSSPSRRMDWDPELFVAAQREAAREIARDPRARGLLYVGTRDGVGSAAIREGLPPGEVAARSGDASTHVYVLGPRGERTAPAHPLVTEVFLDGDKRMADHDFLLFISEHSAYGIVQRPGERLFHSSDVPLVDALVCKLQTLYDLQPI